jgi:hypothetical protein
MTLSNHFIPRVESLEERTVPSAALPPVPDALTSDHVVTPSPDAAASPSVSVNVEQEGPGMTLVAYLPKIPASTVVMVLGGPDRPLGNDGTVRLPLPHGTRIAVLAIRLAGRDLPLVRVDFDGHGQMIRETELTDLRSALRQPAGAEDSMMLVMAAMPSAANGDPVMTSLDSPAPGVDLDSPGMPLSDHELRAMTGAGMATSPVPMPDPMVPQGAGQSGELGTEPARRPDHGVDGPSSEDDHPAAGGELRAEADSQSKDGRPAVVAGDTTHQAGDTLRPVAVAGGWAPPEQLRAPSVTDPTATVAAFPTDPRRWPRPWAVAAALVAVAAGGAYALEKRAQRESLSRSTLED